MTPVAEQISEIRDQGPSQHTPSTVALSAVPCLSSNADGLLLPGPQAPQVALLTGGGDKPYALGMAAALTSAGISVDFVGSDDLCVAELLTNRRINFFNLRGDQNPAAKPARKTARVLMYYWRLLYYSARAKPKIFHILWNNKFQLFDCTLLMLYYKLLRKRIVFTVHNVNAARRDSNDSWLNRLALNAQYDLSDHIFVHTSAMRNQLVADFRVREDKISVIPFGINNTVPKTDLTSGEAKRILGISDSDKTLLFFGNIAPYKGLEYLVSALMELLNKDRSYRLIIAGRPKGSQDYWKQINEGTARGAVRDRIIQRIGYIPDDETELFFKAADVLILPYTRVFQSGVLFLGYSFGLPAIVADVATLKQEIIEGQTGFAFKPQDSFDLESKIDEYFKSDLFSNLENTRLQIKQYANDRYSWSKVAEITTAVYSNFLSSR